MTIINDILLFWIENEHQTSSARENVPDPDNEPSDSQMPCLVIYIIDPFTYCQEWESMNRLSTLGLLRCYQDMLKALPEQLRQCTQLQVYIMSLVQRFACSSSNLHHLGEHSLSLVLLLPSFLSCVHGYRRLVVIFIYQYPVMNLIQMVFHLLYRLITLRYSMAQYSLPCSWSCSNNK